MKVVIECLVDEYLQINSKERNKAHVVLTKKGHKVEFSTHGDFMQFQVAAKTMENAGKVKVIFVNEGVQAPKAVAAAYVAQEPVSPETIPEATTEEASATEVETPKVEAAAKTNKFAPKNKKPQDQATAV